ncbi:MAG: ribosome biogenesis GTPase Der [Cyanobacteria bacterium]|nr:ribosome biogenesis GTPase Der [Cyanobacteriota bacterium]
MPELDAKLPLTKLPIVAVIGRPNVGKSTFVNRLVGGRQAIVDDLPGVTRDRSYYQVEWNGKVFQVVDTGGLVPEAEDFFGPLINQQVEISLIEADLVIFLVDGQAGVTPVDEAIAQMIRQSKKPVLVAVNKVDTFEQRPLIAEFHSLGLGEPYPLSAMHGTGGVGDLLDVVIWRLSDIYEELPSQVEDENPAIKIAIVGRPNVGKSSILNSMAGSARSIVSDISGTTRDSIDIQLEDDGQAFTLVDTAGIRRKGKVEYGIEMFAVDRALRAIRQSNVTVMVIDATEGVTDQDKKIIETSNEAGRGLILVMNKWDLVPDKKPNTVNEFTKDLYHQLPHAKFAPIIFTSAVTGQRLKQILSLSKTVYENAHRRMKTNLVNQVLMEATAVSPPPPIKNRRLKILYSTQVGVGPPTFVLFVNDAKLLKESYQRYLEKKLRESFEFAGTPVVIIARNRDEKK